MPTLTKKPDPGPGPYLPFPHKAADNPSYKIYKSPYELPKSLPHSSLFHYFFPSSSPYSDDLPAFIEGPTGRVLSRGSLKESALKLGLGLQELGLKRGEVVALYSPNSLDYPRVFFGCQAAGLVTSMVNSNYSTGEVAYQVADGDCSAIFVHASLLPTLLAALPTLPPSSKLFQPLPSQPQAPSARPTIPTTSTSPSEILSQSALENAYRRIIVANRTEDIPNLLGKGPVLAASFSAGTSDLFKGPAKNIEGVVKELGRFKSFEAYEGDLQMAKKWGGERFENGKENETALLCYSSGTTGLQKGVETTHHNLSATLTMCHHLYPDLKPENKDSILGMLPMYHVYGLAKLLCNPLRIGVPVVILEQFTPQTFLSTIAKYRCVWSLVVPPVLVVLATSPLVDQYDVSCLKGVISGAAPLGQGLAERVMKRLPGLVVTQGYGLTETSPTSCLLPVDEAPFHIGSTGRLVPMQECRLVGEDGKDVEQGEAGELYFRGPNVMRGYWRNPEATKGTFSHDGWYMSGDVAKLDKDGYFFIVDRKKELIKYKGFQVPPAELEALLLSHPLIADAGVCSIYSDEQATELPRAYVVPVGGVAGIKGKEGELLKAIAEWMSAKAAPHKKLRGGVIFVDSIPKSPSGKILRRELRLKAAREVEQGKRVSKL